MGARVRAIRVDDALWEAVAGRAEAQGTTLSAVIRQLLADWVANQPQDGVAAPPRPVTHPPVTSPEAVAEAPEAKQAKIEALRGRIGALEDPLGPKHLHRMKVVDGATRYVGGRPHRPTRCECGLEGERVG